MQEINTIALMLVWGAIAVALYLLPTLRAYRTRHPQRKAILALNVLAGWTFIGWVGAFVWGCVRTPDDPPTRP
jgi:T4 superinfection immunity protein